LIVPSKQFVQFYVDLQKCYEKYIIQDDQFNKIAVSTSENVSYTL
jgi:hypothetical protein